MFLTKPGPNYNIILAGRESDVSISVEHEPETRMTLVLREPDEDGNKLYEKLKPQDAIAVLYKLWNEGLLIPSKMLIHLQNDVINHIINTTYGSKESVNQNGNPKKRIDE
jgi:hypothetical protein